MSKNPNVKSNNNGDEEDNDDNNDDDDNNRDNNEILQRGCCVKKFIRNMARVPFEGGKGEGPFSWSLRKIKFKLTR